jgi:hypothetical protein
MEGHTAVVTLAEVETLTLEHDAREGALGGTGLKAKDTVPVGLAGVVPAGATGVTVAVKVTAWLTADAPGVDVTAVVVLAAVTT